MCDPASGLGEHLFVIVKTEGLDCQTVVRPDEAFDLRLLDHNIFPRHFGDEEDYLFGDSALRVIFADGAEALKRLDIESGFLSHLADSGLFFVLVNFHMPLRKTPVVALAVFDEQILHIAAVPAEYDGAAGFFVKTSDAGGGEIPAFRQYLPYERLIDDVFFFGAYVINFAAVFCKR